MHVSAQFQLKRLILCLYQLCNGEENHSLHHYLPILMKRRKVSKDERRSMVEKYINNYRAVNGGKFPTVTDAKKNVGGCYYVVKRILEELKYNSKISSVDSTDAHLQKTSQIRKPSDVINDRKPFVDMLDSRDVSRLKSDICEENENSVDTLLAEKAAEENRLSVARVDSLTSHVKVNLMNLGDEKHEVFLNTNANKEKFFTEVLRKSVVVDESITKLLVDHPNSKKLDSKGAPQSLVSSERDNLIDIRTQLHCLDDESKGRYHGTDGKQWASEDLLKNESNPKDKKQLSFESKVPGEHNNVSTEGENPERKSSLWQNLKSFASRILGLGRS